MRKISIITCAALLTSVAFTGCKGDQNNQPVQTQETVKTQFAIAMPDQLGGGGPNKMASTTVQNAGMENFHGMTGITLLPFAKQGAIEATDTRLGSNITLGDLNKAEVDSKTNKAKVYEDVDIPLTTASFLFYAKSKASGTDFEVGALNASPADLDANPAGITFSLKQIQATGASKIFEDGGAGKALLDYLTSVACASDGDATTPKKWYEYTEGDDAGMYAMFNTFTSMNGLSSFEVARVLTDLYKSLKPISSPIATAVKAAINNSTYATINGSDEVVLNTASLDLTQFPSSYSIPDGAVNIRWDGTNHKFVNGLYSNMASLEKYVYPAQLWYYVNSQIKTSNTSQKTAYESTSNAWSDILALHTNGIAVNTLTRAVAIQKPIQYAVARLDVQVKVNAASLVDNSDLAEGKATPVACSAGFPVSAILVGGQQQVKFDFTSNGGTEYTIYDNVMAINPLNAPVGGYSTTNHTLVLENAQNQDVRVAVELTNTTGVDFYGYNNQLIPKGGKFYVVAELDADLANETDKHVFMQDYTTTAKLTLKNLRNAYNTIPDLRTPKLELGFSVDLTWQTGHTYTVDFQ